jgi:hypothetical protein
VVIYSSNNNLREKRGFQYCTSLCRIEIPTSVEKIRSDGLDEWISLHLIIIRTGCRMRINAGLRDFNPFLVSEDDDHLKEGRSATHLEFGRI